MKSPANPPEDPHRKARFRAEAREIVWNDRENRKYGRAYDLGGSIARALERAYRLGFEHGVDGAPQPLTTKEEVELGDGPIDWALLPPRPRKAFWSICVAAGLGLDGSSSGPIDEAVTLLPVVCDRRGTDAWQIEGSGDRWDVFADRSVVPLVRLRLLGYAEEPKKRLFLTMRGSLTWQQFLAKGGDFPGL